jgi:hypothetical protein
MRRSQRLSQKERVNYNYNRRYIRRKPYSREAKCEDERKEIPKKIFYYYCQKCNAIKNTVYCQECNNDLEFYDTDDYTIDSSPE